MSFRIIAAFVIFLFGMRVNAQTVVPSEPLSKALTIFELPPFERAVCCIRYYEGLHRKKDYPYVGYGHRLQPGERYSSEMTASEAEVLLRKDLKKLCSLFRPYGKDSLLLSEISDNIIESFPNCWNIAQNFRRSFRRSASACRFVMVRAEYLSPGCNRCPYPTYG